MEDFYIDEENFCQEELEDMVGLNEAIVPAFSNVYKSGKAYFKKI